MTWSQMRCSPNGKAKPWMRATFEPPVRAEYALHAGGLLGALGIYFAAVTLTSSRFTCTHLNLPREQYEQPGMCVKSS